MTSIANAERDELTEILESVGPSRRAADAILAADYRKITLDDATIERAARALYGTEELPIYDEAREVFTGTKPFDWLSEPFQDSYRIKAKVALGAALLGAPK
jgi:hypothetical protein